MYDALSTRELTVLQSMLFEAAEDSYQMAELRPGDRARVQCYGSVHREIGHLFIEAGTELLLRLDQSVKAA